MKRILSYFGLLLIFASCVNVHRENPYESCLNTLSVQLIYPDGMETSAQEGVMVEVEDMYRLVKYRAYTDDSALASIDVPAGVYRLTVSQMEGSAIFNASMDHVVIGSDRSVSMELSFSKKGAIVIKEIYCGGCSKAPEDGTYQSDKYIILHNNSDETVYLDSLCFGTLAPYNSNAPSQPWNGIAPFAPIIQALWQFGGDGRSFPMAPGEDDVVCISGAIDHTASYPLSVNLNKEDYFVCYNNIYFPNTVYHPVPGDKIRQDHILNVVEKMGQANAYTFSNNSPAVVIFRPVGQTIQEYLAREGSIVQVPGSNIDKVIVTPWSWIMDGVEVFSAQGGTKRIRASVDAGYVILTQTFKGLSLMRKVDEAASSEAGYEVLVDTNNSSVDFYERATASLHD